MTCAFSVLYFSNPINRLLPFQRVLEGPNTHTIKLVSVPTNHGSPGPVEDSSYQLTVDKLLETQVAPEPNSNVSCSQEEGQAGALIGSVIKATLAFGSLYVTEKPPGRS